MKTLIVEDDFTSRIFLQEILRRYGAAHVAVNGREAVDAVRAAMDLGEPYELVCLDIMMPEMDGHEALKKIRATEEARGVIPARRAKIFMTTALGDLKSVAQAFNGLCDVYLQKPIEKTQLLEHLRESRLIE
jgi:two-component system chemotaxis response regulator CheY